MTCIGVLIAAIVVKPTISEKNTVADSKSSGCTISPALSRSAQVLKTFRAVSRAAFGHCQTKYR